MKKRRTNFLKAKMPEGFRFLRLVMLLIVVAFFTNAYLSIKMIERDPTFIGGTLSYLIWQLNFGVIVVLLLITLMHILHRGFGALTRVEGILEQILKGDYSQRIYLRRGDFLRSFIAKVNKVLDQLESSNPKKK